MTIYIILLLLITNCVMIVGELFSDTWAVHVEGGLENAQSVAQQHGFTFSHQIMPNYYQFSHRKVSRRSVESSDHYHKRLVGDNRVKWAEQQIVKRRVKRDSGSFNDPKWPSLWYLNRGAGLDMNVMTAYQRWNMTGRGIVVTILDDGIEKDHPDLQRNYDAGASYDVNAQDNDPQPRYDVTNENRHGTRCAGEVAAQANNNICSVGVAYDASIGGVRMLDGDVTDAVEAQSISLNPQHIDIYSASWGPDDDGRTVDGPGPLAKKAFIDGIKNGRHGRGSIYVWASGNGGSAGDGCNCDGYTNSVYTLSISSATENGNVPWYSEACSSTLASTYSSGQGSDRQIITTDLRKSCTDTHTGTSASAPLAAGICALALQANPSLTWRDLQHIVVMTAKKANLQADDWVTNGAGKNVSHHFGFGIMDASAMVELASSWKTVPEQRRCVISATFEPRSVPVNGHTEVEVFADGCNGTGTEILYLEHVEAVVTLSTSFRGQVEIFLKSPQGTKSSLLAFRRLDSSADGFNEWPFMTTHNWGESPTGKWKLEVRNRASVATLKRWTLTLYGTEVHPVNHVIPQSMNSVNLSLGSSHTNNTTADKCSDDEYLLRSLCYSVCPVGFFPFNRSSAQYNTTKTTDTTNKTDSNVTTSRVCLACHATCSQCNGSQYSECTACVFSRRLSALRFCVDDTPSMLKDRIRWRILAPLVVICFLVIGIVITLLVMIIRRNCSLENENSDEGDKEPLLNMDEAGFIGKPKKTLVSTEKKDAHEFSDDSSSFDGVL